MSALAFALLLSAAACGAAAAESEQQCYDLQTGILGRSGIKFGQGTYGVQTDVNKQPVVQLLELNKASFLKPLGAADVAKRASGRFTKDAKLAHAYSNAPDIPTLLEVSRVRGFCCRSWSRAESLGMSWFWSTQRRSTSAVSLTGCQTAGRTGLCVLLLRVTMNRSCKLQVGMYCTGYPQHVCKHHQLWPQLHMSCSACCRWRARRS